MYKKTITYSDLDGNPVTEDFYFHLSKAEVAEMELSAEGGYSAQLERIVKEQNAGQIIATFKEILTKAYGVRSTDNKQFIKSSDLTMRFIQSDAFSELFMELVTNAEAASEFVRGVMPKGLEESMKEIPGIEEAQAEKPKDEKKAEADFTRDELLNLSDEEFAQIVGTDPQKMSKRGLQVAFQRKAR